MIDRTLDERIADLDTVEAVVDRLALSGDESAAMRRVLGLEDEAARLALAFVPELPPPPAVGVGFDHLAHARKAVAEFQARVDSFPDGDATPLVERERLLRKAILDVERLSAATGGNT